jgi:hypothetical protein
VVGRRVEVGGGRYRISRQRGGEKKNLDGQGGCSFAKWVERAHLQLVHWWLLVHSSPT